MNTNRMQSNIVLLIVLTFVTPLSVCAEGKLDDDLLPEIGSRVRVMAPKLGKGWHFGMFNQLRVPASCYRVLIFGESNSIQTFLTVNDITKIQVSTIYNKGFVGTYDPTKPNYPDEEWVDVSIKTWKALAKNCSTNE